MTPMTMTATFDSRPHRTAPAAGLFGAFSAPVERRKTGRTMCAEDIEEFSRDFLLGTHARPVAHPAPKKADD
jgi:hypothetical protein